MVHAGAGRVQRAALRHLRLQRRAAASRRRYQSLEHPVADHAKAVMQLAAAGTGVRALGRVDQRRCRSARRAEIEAAWRLHARLVRRSLERGYYQGWDLHPLHLVTRYAATYAFYREGCRARATGCGPTSTASRRGDHGRAGDRAGAGRAARARPALRRARRRRGARSASGADQATLEPLYRRTRSAERIDRRRRRDRSLFTLSETVFHDTEVRGRWPTRCRYLANCSLLFTELPLLERPAAAKAAGFDAIEFWWPFADAGARPTARSTRSSARSRTPACS